MLHNANCVARVRLDMRVQAACIRAVSMLFSILGLERFGRERGFKLETHENES